MRLSPRPHKRLGPGVYGADQRQHSGRYQPSWRRATSDETLADAVHLLQRQVLHVVLLVLGHHRADRPLLLHHLVVLVLEVPQPVAEPAQLTVADQRVVWNMPCVTIQFITMLLVVSWCLDAEECKIRHRWFDLNGKCELGVCLQNVYALWLHDDVSMSSVILLSSRRADSFAGGYYRISYPEDALNCA